MQLCGQISRNLTFFKAYQYDLGQNLNENRKKIRNLDVNFDYSQKFI